ncbi:hypothetical protein GYH30_010077 [Glycine max]|nr:hypothetical protein GYH30_010077 [Glycine max]
MSSCDESDIMDMDLPLLSENSNPGYLWSWSVAANRSSSLYSS